ncbi:MAG: class I SAM-dependent methyltransferase [Alphaproteobacteria bacterium]|nr:class I SAM-dependent methyltransferase [Alphaproteobacteria bacterium]
MQTLAHMACRTAAAELPFAKVPRFERKLMADFMTQPSSSIKPGNVAPCFVCGGEMLPYFRKRFDSMGLGEVEYVRCVKCGFVQSHTHRHMTEEQWAQLNVTFHQYHFGTGGAGTESGVPYVAQAEGVQALAQAGVIPQQRPWVDYACGQGNLAKELLRHGLVIGNYDKYPPPDATGYLDDDAIRPGRFDLVINSAMFEHVRERRVLDEIVRLRSPEGVFALHTLICDEVPNDPKWGYFVPEVHIAFFTNRSMQQLFGQWGFKSCLYHVPSMFWFFLPRRIEDLPAAAKDILKLPDWIVKNAFADASYFRFILQGDRFAFKEPPQIT